MSKLPNAPINESRLWNSLMTMAQHGALPNGGCCRLALSDDDKEGRDLFVSWAIEAGCEIILDQAGNIIARRPGIDANAKPVATGSHLDTQPHGGKFDGIYGVLAGLEAVRAMNDADIQTQRPIDIVVFTNEEGARFTPPLTGSLAYAGKLDVATIHAIRTRDGTTVGEDLARIDYLGTNVPNSHPPHAFVEAHIEQGPVLEAEGKVIGIVDRVQGLFIGSVTIQGEDGHAGTVPMDRRRDACMGAAEMVTFLGNLARETSEDVRMTVGTLNISPSSIATIPGAAEFTIDCRHPNLNTLDHLQSAVEEGLHAIAVQRNLEMTFKVDIRKNPVQFDETIVSVVEQTAEVAGYPHRRMLSGAGHDAMNVAEIAPTAMIFIPCEGGISHNEKEFATPEHAAAGAAVLCRVLLGIAG